MTFYCLFCDQRCHHSCPDLFEWWCKACNVIFRDDIMLEMMRFTLSNPDGSYYSLTIDFLNRTTYLAKYRGPKRDDEPWEAYDELPKSVTIAYLHEAVKGVTPQNLRDKIQTILTFL